MGPHLPPPYSNSKVGQCLSHVGREGRDEAKKKLYKNANAPDTLALMGDQVPLPPDKRLGKFMLSEVRSSMHARFSKEVNLLTDSDYLYSEFLRDVAQ